MIRFGNARLTGILVAMCAAVTSCAWQLNEGAVEALVKNTATQTSLDAAKYFIAEIPNLDGILHGKVIPAEDKKFIETILQAKGITTLKLYDKLGNTIFDSSAIASGSRAEIVLGQHNPAALAALNSGKPFVKLEEEAEDGAEKLLSETYVTFALNGEAGGVAEVYIDQTATARLFRQSFGTFAAFIAALVCLSFSFPALAFLQRTRQKDKADEDIRFMQSHDSLTRLPNRAQLTLLLGKAMVSCSETAALTAVHYIDLDLFKDVNEKHGHEAGNLVLQAVAARLISAVRDTDIVARLGADEFVVAQCGMPDHMQLADLTKRIIDVFSSPFRTDSNEVCVTASIGTAVGLRGAVGAATLIDNADTAAFVTKSRGRNGHCFFEARFTEERRDYVNLEMLVRRALAEDRFELHYQPIYSFERKLTGFEALLRLRDGSGNFISPMKFIPVAEEVGLIDQIGSWVLKHSSITAVAWPDELKLSVNLSAAQFKRRSVVAATRSALAASGLHASRLLLEITESTLLRDTDAVIGQLQELKALGTSIVMDDFGTGYSSLGYMLKFPFDQIKIDRSFVMAIGAGNANASSVIQTIVTLGHSLKMRVTAEGVETEVQATALRNMKCDHVQGYLFGKPMPATEVAALVLRSFQRETTKPETLEGQLPAAVAITA